MTAPETLGARAAAPNPRHSEAKTSASLFLDFVQLGQKTRAVLYITHVDRCSETLQKFNFFFFLRGNKSFTFRRAPSEFSFRHRAGEHHSCAVDR